MVRNENRSVVPGLVLVLLMAGLFAAGVTSANAADSKPAAVVTTTDQPLGYAPDALTAKVGSTVQWKNTGKILHAVVTRASDIPSGAKVFNSPYLQPGQTFSYTFDRPGTYTYFCPFHSKRGLSGMVGKVIVTK